MLHIKFGFDWPSSFREEGCSNILVIYMYIAPGQAGAENPLGLKYYNKHKSSVHLLIPSNFSVIKLHFIFPIQIQGQPKLTLQ